MSTTLNLYQRILKVMTEVDTVMKEDKKVNGQYRFVSHDAVTKALHNPCMNAGLVLVPSVVNTIQDGNRTELTIELTIYNADKPEEKIVCRGSGFGIDGQDKGPGKAFSYAYKMLLLKLFMLESGEEDNERSLEDHKKSPALVNKSYSPKPNGASFGKPASNV